MTDTLPDTGDWVGRLVLFDVTIDGVHQFESRTLDSPESDAHFGVGASSSGPISF